MKLRYKSSNMLILEAAPAIRTVYFHVSSVRHKPPVKYRISLPYVIFRSVFHGAQIRLNVCCRTRPMNSPTDEICFLPLPNIYSDTAFACLGHIIFQPEMRRNNDLLTVTKRAIAEFWSNSFTYSMDRSLGAMYSVSRGQEMLERLAYKTKKDPLYWEKENFKLLPNSILELPSYVDWKDEEI